MPRLLCWALLWSLSSAALALDISGLWDFGNPRLSEARFTAALASASEDDKLLLTTQIARTHGMRRDFAKARDVLASIEPRLPQASAEVRVRHALELGRSYASPVHGRETRSTENLERARTHFLRAYELASAARLDNLAIDALHMMPVVDETPDRQLEWNAKALAVMERSDQADAKRWEGSLRYNIAYARHLQGEHGSALEQLRLARAAYERAGRLRGVRYTDWMIARTYRAQGRFAEALSLQLELERAWERDGTPDPEVFEELEHLYRALGDEPRARLYGDRRKAASP